MVMISLDNFNFYHEKVMSGLIAGAVGVFFDTLMPLFICVFIFEAIDFITGIMKSYVHAKRNGERFAFESIKAWRTIYKIVFILLGIVLSEMLDSIISEESLRLANFFTAFCCGIEFWSFLENAAEISEHPVFRWLKKFMKHKVENEIGESFDNMKEE